MHWWSKPVHDFNKLMYWCSKLVQGFNRPEHYCTIHQYLNPVHGCSSQVEYNTTVLIINQYIGEAKQCIKYWTANYHMVQQASTRTSTSIGSKMICPRTFRPPKIQPRKVYPFLYIPVSFIPECGPRFVPDMTHCRGNCVCYVPEFVGCGNFWSLFFSGYILPNRTPPAHELVGRLP
jgi:hypothetical protein